MQVTSHYHNIHFFQLFSRLMYHLEQKNSYKIRFSQEIPKFTAIYSFILSILYPLPCWTDIRDLSACIYVHNYVHFMNPKFSQNDYTM